MTWLQRYRVRHYTANAIWIFPVLGMVAALGAARLLGWIETMLGWESGIHPDTARAVLGALAAAMFTFVVFVCSVLLVAVQLASAQLTPRVIALVFREPVTKLALTLFVFTFTFALAALVRIKTSVPFLTVHLAAYSCLASLAVFLFLIDRVCRLLRPSGAVRSVARIGREVIEKVYPERLGDPEATSPGPADLANQEATTIPSPTDGVVLAFDLEGLLSLARRADGVIELVPEVGDFVAAGDPLFRVFRGAATLPVDVLYQSIAVGQERTLEQDPTFAFRILVDIACKGLSPAINDPTTAVGALDQIHHLLRNVGSRQLLDGQLRGGEGRLRVIYRTPNWEDFVQLAVTEIRHFGGQSIQVTRRLRAMLQNLLETLPEVRASLLRQELDLLRRSAQRAFPEPEDRALADVSDLQGVGGTPGA
jgi:uncharacterized membrane protein